MHPIHLDKIRLSCTYQSSQRNFPTNPNSDSLHSFCTSMLITIPGSFDISDPSYPLMIESLRELSAEHTSGLVLWVIACMAVIPSLSTLFLPTCAKTYPPFHEPIMFSTLSRQGKQTTTSSPLFKSLSGFLTIDSRTNILALSLTTSITTSE